MSDVPGCASKSFLLGRSACFYLMDMDTESLVLACGTVPVISGL